MKRPLLTCCLVLTAAAAFGRETPAKKNKPEPPSIHDMNKKLGRGINLGNALEGPNEGAWGVTLKAEYFQAIKKAGFDSVRLPVRWSAHAKATEPFTLDEPFAKRVDWAIEQALANKLNIIVNVHHYDEMDKEPEKHLARLLGLWQQIAARYKDRPAGVFFELYNEPHGELDSGKWNIFLPHLLRAVRKTNPTRPIIVGPGHWNAVQFLDKLKLPEFERNLIVTVHYYGPFEFTHQGAPWVQGSAKWKGRKWTGTAEEVKALRQELEKAAAWGKTHDRPIFLGEFGAYQEADMASRAKWTEAVVQEAQRLGFSWAYWEFCAGFGAYDPKTDTWRAPLKKALLGE
jgi:endoglucanase